MPISGLNASFLLECIVVHACPLLPFFISLHIAFVSFAFPGRCCGNRAHNLA